MSIRELLSCTAVSTTALLAFTALLLFVAMSVQNKAGGSVIGLLVAIGMLFATLVIYQRLDAPEFYEGYSYVDEDTGEMITVDREKNTRYLTGTKREVYKFLYNFIPVSQLYQIAMNNTDNLIQIVIYDCAIIVITTGAGIAVFKRMNLK